ncbi:MAG: PQQ-dependent sugar dehydrogenase [Gemmatimonadales bacterium]
MRSLAIIAAFAAVACTSTDSNDPGIIPTEFKLSLQSVASGFNSPVYITSPPGDSRLFVVEQPGRIRIISGGQLITTPFLDITSKVSSGGERGLLSVAFHPQYATNGFFYVYFTGSGGELRIERYSVTANANVANAASAKVILTVPHPVSNHNGGLAMFGPDGMLYLGLGDGGGAGDPNLNGQNTNTLLGALLRIDVNNGDPYSIPSNNPFAGRNDAKQEIWAIGLRNPWRYSFDRVTGLLYIADVGQNLLEEVNIVPSTRAGVNYGWNVMEATSCYNASTCNKTGLEIPVLEYSHSDGSCSITGGFAYRGSALPEIAGHYFYADYCLGKVKSFLFQNGVATDKRTWDLISVGAVTSFGEDAAGELYLTSANGGVYKIVRGALLSRALRMAVR